MIHPHDTAFPIPPSILDTERGQWIEPAPGLTVRAYFAGLAMQGISANYPRGAFEIGIMAETSVQLADALIAELNKETK